MVKIKKKDLRRIWIIAMLLDGDKWSQRKIKNELNRVIFALEEANNEMETMAKDVKNFLAEICEEIESEELQMNDFNGDNEDYRKNMWLLIEYLNFEALSKELGINENEKEYLLDVLDITYKQYDIDEMARSLFEDNCTDKDKQFLLKALEKPVKPHEYKYYNQSGLIEDAGISDAMISKILNGLFKDNITRKQLVIEERRGPASLQHWLFRMGSALHNVLKA